MKKFKKIFAHLALIPMSLAASTTEVNLQDVNPLGAGVGLPELIKKIFDGLSVLLIAIVPIMIIIGAFQMMFSAGDPVKFAKGQKTIVYAVIGLAVLLLSQGIVAIVERILLSGV
ncbi:MAG: hypothetical protein COU11_01845 [Candidatus Harrisonbacteria bacterium CG10_big_fil_rev_8_21_14_0_10_49_15]|uniref:TrbC/VIRB2 family protein n=1 Tax=Candidatus Harrisonbacteria bacterium CG10_big_fil_rev_8_21_14_0_10_49_15 TaxID=1974587 RepID=A0A2H0ULC1_9BACT|nr:MAG: hypothetical protein COU11_01845 [Candidatus Harrisonbacteria bacterium CG10_big_fil_rev_8_21_14_0_10_49_15]